MIGLSTLMFNFPSSILLQFKILSIGYVIHEKKTFRSFFRAFSQGKNANRKEFYLQITLDHRDVWVFFHSQQQCHSFTLCIGRVFNFKRVPNLYKW